MARFFDSAIGVLAGFFLGWYAFVAFGLFGLSEEGPGIGPWVTAFLGAVAGGVLGALFTQPSGAGRNVARWCVGMAALVGVISFLAGFVGPILLKPDSPQGPLLGILITGPLGVVVGAILGLVIGLARQGAHRADAR